MNVCVFCGSRAGDRPLYAETAHAFGKLLATRGDRLVYGGGSVGLMGHVADGVLAGGGEVTGVIPEFLATSELRHPGVADMRLTTTMHTRKSLMAECSDAFVALPGGLGTFDELFEILTWAQLGLHAKPIGVLNVNGYFDPFLQLIERSVSDGFCSAEQRALFHCETDPVALLNWLSQKPASTGRREPPRELQQA